MDPMSTSAQEHAAMNRAVEWVKRDPFYADNPTLSPRDWALMRLALRCFTEPLLTESRMEMLAPVGTAAPSVPAVDDEALARLRERAASSQLCDPDDVAALLRAYDAR